MSAPDTIVAPATPPGRGGIGIVRVSGPGTRPRRDRRARPPARAAPRDASRFSRTRRGDTIDVGLALYFPAPDSFTGEDVLELHGHGGPVVMDLLVARADGARRAPGAAGRIFRARLPQRQARPGAGGGDRGPDLGGLRRSRARGAALARRACSRARSHALAAKVMELRAYVEAAIDFPDEDAEFLESARGARAARGHRRALRRASRTRVRQGRALRDGLHVVIAGRPNAGKSSLLNALAGFDAAIVTEIPGTTRDLLRERIHVDGLPIHVVDTAGLRDTDDVIEIEGLRRARMEMSRADLVLYVVDATRGFAPRRRSRRCPPARRRSSSGTRWTCRRRSRAPALDDRPVVAVSALTGAGLPLLREQLKSAAGYQSESGAWSARRRHLDALARAQSLFEVAEGAAGGARLVRARGRGTPPGAPGARRSHRRGLERRGAGGRVRNLLYWQVISNSPYMTRN